MYTFDALTKPKHYAALMTNDEIKARKRAAINTAVYSLLLATHVGYRFDRRYEGIVKYRAGIAKAIERHQTADQVRELAGNAMRQNFGERNIVYQGEVHGGTIFGADVSLLFWLARDAHLAS